MKYVALLRGINVGGNNKLAMKNLKVIFEDLGFINVSTYINSGNVLFESPEANQQMLATTIEAAIHDATSLSVKTLVKSAAEIAQVAKLLPAEWVNDVTQRTEVMFFWDEAPQKDIPSLIKTREGVDCLLYANGVLIWNISRINYSKSALRDFISNPLYKLMTGRNCNTVRTIYARLCEE